uniref:Uncharacterized protein n=1 Tax=Caenorhabditis tropicalis TaxID=1561998 RepID=A0A1I7TJ25_9PELO
MCRWFSIFVLPYFVCVIWAQEQEGKNSLTRPIHPRRHKRAEQVHAPVVFKNPFVLWTNDPQCKVVDRIGMACPKKNPHEKTKCIEMHEVCDDHQDCPGGEDEDAHFCMFKKLEDAEIRRIKDEIYVLAQYKGDRAPTYRDIVVSNDVSAPHSSIKQPLRDRIYQTNDALGPLGKSKMYQNAENEEDPNKSVEGSEEESEEEEEEDEEDIAQREADRRATERREEARRRATAAAASAQHAKRRRSYRHLLQLEAANFI